MESPGRKRSELIKRKQATLREEALAAIIEVTAAYRRESPAYARQASRLLARAVRAVDRLKGQKIVAISRRRSPQLRSPPPSQDWAAILVRLTALRLRVGHAPMSEEEAISLVADIVWWVAVRQNGATLPSS